MGLLNWMRGLMGRKHNNDVSRDMSREQVATVAKANVKAPKKKTVRPPVDYSKSFAIFDLFRSPFRYTARRKRSRVSVSSISRICPGGRHAWFESNVGLIRKPIE